MTAATNEQISQLLDRGVVDCTVRTDLEAKLRSGKRLRIKFGIDPTGFDLHLGHLLPLRKLAQFQQLGHTAVLLFGTFTGKIGDPTGKDKLRVPLTDDDIAKNMATYLRQVSIVLDLDKTEVVKNGDWLETMNFGEVLQLASCFTASQMMQREMFSERLKSGNDINLVEFFYPLMQGYDSVAINCDVEIGGTDQLFNLHAGRKIQERFGQTPQIVLTVPILEGLNGKQKMSKSLGNHIPVLDPPAEVFGKTMSLPDTAMARYFELATDLPASEYQQILAGHPRDAKLRLAQEITTLLHDATAAESAQQQFLQVFQKGDLPDQMPQLTVDTTAVQTIWQLVNASGLCATSSDAKRMITQGAVSLAGEKLIDPKAAVLISGDAQVLKVGKRKFVEVVAQ